MPLSCVLGGPGYIILGSLLLTFSGFGLGALNVYVGGWGTGIGARFIRAIKTQKKSKGQNNCPYFVLFVKIN